MDFFLQRGGVSPIPKGCYHKKMGILGYFCQKGGSYRFYQKKTQNISDFFAKWGGGLANSKISLSEKTRPFQIAERGGGSQNFGVFLKKKKQLFFMPPLTSRVKRSTKVTDLISLLSHFIEPIWFFLTAFMRKFLNKQSSFLDAFSKMESTCVY